MTAPTVDRAATAAVVQHLTRLRAEQDRHEHRRVQDQLATDTRRASNELVAVLARELGRSSRPSIARLVTVGPDGQLAGPSPRRTAIVARRHAELLRRVKARQDQIELDAQARRAAADRWYEQRSAALGGGVA